MAGNGPDPAEFFDRAQRMLRELFGDQNRDDDPWARATRRQDERSGPASGHRELSPEQQRENLTFALATRAVEALEDVALNVAAIRQRLERADPPVPTARPEDEARNPDATGAAGQ